jgi:hypothetical protein
MTGFRRTAALAAIALAPAITLAGCALVGGGNERELSYEVYQDAPQRGDSDFVPSSFIPTDARNLRVRVVTDGPGSVVSYESPTGTLGEGCQPGSFDDDPLLRAAWWPDDVPSDGLICGDWRVFEENGTTYAFSR